MTATAGQVLSIAAPSDLSDGVTTCNSAAYLFRESNDIISGENVVADILLPGRYDAQNLPAPNGGGTYSYGRSLDTYLLHLDSTGIETIVQGSVTFEQPILGVLTNGFRQSTTDALLGAPGTVYPPDNWREVEWDTDGPEGPPISYVELSPDRHTLTFRLRVGGNELDQIRIVTTSVVASCAHAFFDDGSVPGCSGTLISADTTMFDGCHIVVGPCYTLTIDGPHEFASLALLGPDAVVTHSLGSAGGLNLVVAGEVYVNAGARIDVSGRGNGPHTGPGAPAGTPTGRGGAGAGHGGHGGFSTDFAGGPTYGTAAAPTLFGSGGGTSSSAARGGIGGGAIRLVIDGTLTLDGTVAAEGLEGGRSGTCARAGGGSGGSIWIDAETFTGAGHISVRGGRGHTVTCASGGGGGGGRIAVYHGVNSYAGTMSASGGTGHQHGGAGSMVVGQFGQPTTTIFDNGNLAGAATDLDQSMTQFDNVVVRNQAWLTHEAGLVGWGISATGDLTIDATGAIDVTGRGFPAGEGPGSVPLLQPDRGNGGAGHGGNGGAGSHAAGGPTYGIAGAPTALGSGGGSAGSAAGGAGGGALQLTVAGTLTVDGAIRANGLTGGGDGICTRGGGGAGGSIWIETGTLAGTGSISAGGGTGRIAGCNSGGGGGGRVAVYYDNSSFSGIIAARGASGHQGGGAGSVVLAPSDAPTTTIFDNGGLAGAATDLIDSIVSFENLIVRNQAHVAHPSDLNAWRLQVTGDAAIEATGRIDVSGRGWGPGSGPGTVPAAPNDRGNGGAGHGGNGGSGSHFPGGTTYGSATVPTLPGSGGGSSGSVPGGAGGGALHLAVVGTLTVDGAIRSDGVVGSASGMCGHAGGGSGGSIRIDSGALSGSGVISARGGAGPVGSCGAGGGGGGRVAIYSCDVQLPIGSVNVAGGSGLQAGLPGTVHFGSSFIVITQQPLSQILNDGQPATISVQATSSLPGELVYQWRRKDSSGEYVALVEGPGFPFTGVNTPVLHAAEIHCNEDGDFDCLITDACGSFPSDHATLNVVSAADWNQDTATDSSDISAYLTSWLASLGGGTLTADFNSDNQVNSTDISAFLTAWLDAVTHGC